MAWEWLFKGVLLGLAIAAPLGPIGIYCIQKPCHRDLKADCLAVWGRQRQMPFTAASPGLAYPPSSVI